MCGFVFFFLNNGTLWLKYMPIQWNMLESGAFPGVHGKRDLSTPLSDDIGSVRVVRSWK